MASGENRGVKYAEDKAVLQLQQQRRHQISPR